MKKIALLLALCTVLTILPIYSRAQPNPAPQSSQFTVSIPSGTKTIGIAQGASSTLGSVQYVSGGIDSYKIVSITAQKGALRLDGTSTTHYAAYSLSGGGSWQLTAPGSEAVPVTATVTDVSHVRAAGTYSDTITFTVSVSTPEPAYRDSFPGIDYSRPIPRTAGYTAKPIVISMNPDMPRWQRYMAAAFEGLANRRGARVYLNWEDSDSIWLDRWAGADLYRLRPSHQPLTGLPTLISAAPDQYNVRGLLVYNEAILNQATWSMLINVYTAICGAEDLIPVPSSQRSLYPNLPVVFDASQGGKTLGQWNSESEAYIWAIGQYPVLSRSGAPTAHQHPSCLREADYYVQNKMLPIFYWAGMTQACKNAFAQYFLSTGSNGLIVGCWDIPSWNSEYSAQRGMPGMGNALSFVNTDGDGFAPEHTFVNLTSGYGKSLLCTGEKGVSNLSFQAGLPLIYSKPKRPDPAPSYVASKTYLALLVSDGDNIGYLHEASDSNFGLTTGRWWGDPARGTNAVTWTVAPGAAALVPGTVSYLYDTALPGDSFAGAASGWGYILLRAYGKTLAPGPGRDAAIASFYTTTGEYMQSIGLSAQHILWSYNKPYVQNRTAELSDLGIAQSAMLSKCPQLSALYSEYGYNLRSIPSQYRTERINGTPLFQPVNDVINHLSATNPSTGQPYYVSTANQITAEQVLGNRFMQVFCTNWFVQPGSLAAMMNHLGGTYESIGAAQMGSFWKQVNP